MQALDLNVIQRMGVQRPAGLAVQVVGESDLVLVLDIPQFLQYLFVLRILGKFGKLLRVVMIARSDALVQKRGEKRVGITQPAAVRNSVGHVAETLGIHGVKVLELRTGQDLGVQFGNAVDRVGADHAQVCHMHLTVADQTHLGDPVPVSGESFPCVLAEALVDLLDDRMDSRQLQAEQILVPGFKRLGHDRVVGVGADRNDRLPRLFPRIKIFVHKDPHQLGDTQRRVGIVDVDCHLIRQVVKRAVDRHMVSDNALAGSRHHKILLGKAQQLALGMVIRRIQHLGNDLRIGALLHGTGILSLREKSHIEVVDVPCTPQPELAYRLAVRTRYHHVVGDRFHLVIVLIADLQVSVLPVFLDVTAHFHVVNAVGSRHQPDLAARQPDIGQLHLHSIHDHLLEQTVFIADRKAGRRIIQRGKSIEIARRKPPKTAVSESRIRLALIQRLQVKAEILQCDPVFLRQPEVAEIVFERSPQKKLNGHIIHPLGTLCVYRLLEIPTLLRQDVFYRHGNRFIHLLGRCVLRRTAEITGELCLYAVLYFRWLEFLIHFPVPFRISDYSRSAQSQIERYISRYCFADAFHEKSVRMIFPTKRLRLSSLRHSAIAAQVRSISSSAR